MRVGFLAATLLACTGEPAAVTTSAPAPADAPVPPATGQAGEVRLDAYGDPLPVGATNRLGTSRLRHPSDVADLAWAEAGKLLVSAAADGGVRAWDGATGQRVVRLGEVVGTAVAASPSGDRVAVASPGVRVIDVATGGVSWSTPEPSRVGDIAFSPDGTLIAVGSGGALDVVRADTGASVLHLEDHRDRVLRVAWSPDGALLASADASGLVCVREASTGSLRSTVSLTPGAARADVLAFSPDGRLLVAGSDPVEVRDAGTGEFLRDLTGYGPARFGSWRDEVLTLVHGGPPATVVAWIPSSGRSTVAWRDVGADVPTVVAVSPDGQRMAMADATGRIALRAGKDGAHLDVRVGHDREVTAVAYAGPDVLWSAGDGGRVLRWDVPTGRATALSQVHSGGATSIALSADRSRILTGGWDGVVREWDTASLRLVRTLPAGAPASAGWRADGVPVTFSAERGLLVWLDTGPVTLAPARTGVLAIDPSGQVVTIPSASGTVVVDLSDGTVRNSLDALATPAANLQAAAFSPDGSQVAFASADSKTWVVSAAGGESARVLAGPAGLVGGVAWSPDGQRMVTTHSDRAWLWNVASGAPTSFLAGHDDFTTAVTWSLDGRTVATASADGTILLWDAP